MYFWCLEPFGKINPAISKLVQRGQIISNVDNTVHEAKTLTSQHKHVNARPRPKFANLLRCYVRLQRAKKTASLLHSRF